MDSLLEDVAGFQLLRKVFKRLLEIRGPFIAGLEFRVSGAAWQLILDAKDDEG